MSVAVSMALAFDESPYPNLPRTIKPWVAQGNTTGTAGGGSNVGRLEFNTSSTRKRQLYVFVQGASIHASVADPKDFEILATGGDWQKSPGGDRCLGTLVTVPSGVATPLWGGSSEIKAYLGKAELPGTGEIIITGDEVNTCVSRFYMWGFASDNPHLFEDFRRA